MKKQVLSIMTALTLTAFVGCKNGENQEVVHWSHKDCVQAIVNDLGVEEYTYTAKQVSYASENSDDEIYCFDITLTVGEIDYRYCCYAVVEDGEVLFVDCDAWVD